MLSLFNSLLLYYLCQIADVVVPAGVTPDKIVWLRTEEIDEFLSCFLSRHISHA
jgi:hypothetical protein